MSPPELGVGHAAPEVHHASWRCGGVAVRGARAATWKIADNRILRGSHACGRELLGSPHSSSSRSMSSSHGPLHRSSRPSRPRRLSRSSLPRRWIRSAPVSSLAWRVRAATSPDCRSSRPIRPASVLSFCARWSDGLRRLAIMANVDAAGAVIETREIAATARALNLDVILLEIQCVKDIAPAIERSRPAQTHFMWRPIPSCSPIGSEPMPWREVRDCRQSTAVVSMSKREL